MKIAIIVRRLNVAGGIQRHVLSVAHELQKLGETVVIYTFSRVSEDVYPELRKGLRIVSLDDGASRDHKKRTFLSLWFEEKRRSRALALRIDKDTDILNPHDAICYQVAFYFKKHVRSIPSVWTMHDMPSRGWSAWRRRQVDSNFQTSLFKKISHWLIDTYERRKFIRIQDKVVVLDNRDKRWVREFFHKDAVIVRNGLSAQNFPFSVRPPLTNRKVLLLMHGIFLSHRRFEDGIQAAKQLIDNGYTVQLSIVGDYTSDAIYYERIRTLVTSLGLKDCVIFHGKVSEEALRKIYRESDIFIFPNHLQSWGLAVFEAMASGMPVIVSRTAGAHEVLTDGQNALLIAPKSPDEIVRALQSLIDDDGLFKGLSKEGRVFVDTKMSWEKTAQEMLDIFIEIT